MPNRDEELESELDDICAKIQNKKIATQTDFDARIEAMEKEFVDEPGLGDAVECAQSTWQEHQLMNERARKIHRKETKKAATKGKAKK
jgi:hypothetical protein